jgi:hypothetical protein
LFEPGHAKVGGRKAGTPNKITQRTREFFAEVLERAYSDPTFELNLVKSIVNLEIDPKTLSLILEYAGATKADQHHKHDVEGMTEQLFRAVLGKDAPPADEANAS